VVGYKIWRNLEKRRCVSACMRTCELAKREKEQLTVGEPDKVVFIKTAVKKLCGTQMSQVRVESCISKSLHCANSWINSPVRRDLSVNIVPSNQPQSPSLNPPGACL
jgi:hypothetical protein